MKLKIITMGVLQVNNYLLFDEESKEIVLIDAGGDFQQTKNAIDELQGNLKYILHTHGHMDHIAGDYDLQKEYNVSAFVHEQDADVVAQFKEYLQMMGMPDFNTPTNIHFISSGQQFKLGNKIIKLIPTPGHTKGGVSYLIDNMLFSGDTLFYESIGRSDFPGGNHEELISSIKNKLFTLSDDIVVYPGHGPKTSIAHEKVNNFYL